MSENKEEAIQGAGCNYLEFPGRICMKCGSVHTGKALSPEDFFKAELPGKPIDVPSMMYESGYKACKDAMDKDLKEAMRLLDYARNNLINLTYEEMRSDSPGWRRDYETLKKKVCV